MSGTDGRIGSLWAAFLALPPDAIPWAASDASVCAVYTEYESDHTSAYDLIVGKPTAEPANADGAAPEAMVTVHIPAASYLVFAAAGRSPTAIVAAWISVYEYFAQPGVSPRAFTFDFEEYSANGVELYIAVR